jgi:hypothetical protein
MNEVLFMFITGINLDEFGADNFFDAVGISNIIKSENFSQLFTDIQDYI